MSKLRVAIVGAGLSGLAAIKQCLDDGLEPHCFEARPEIGGLWAYEPDANTAQSSAYAGLILNSCRDTSAFSDFPLDPARYPDYFSHRQFLRYLHEYADHFGLKQHIRLSTRVVSCTPPAEGTEGKGGRWTVRIESAAAEGGDVEVLEDEFDAIFACTGHSTAPHTPDFNGLGAFRGTWMHSHAYRTPGPFEGKKVAIIGLGSSAVDIACEVGPQAAECHIITRRGGWILPRYIMGKVAEAWDNRATQVLLPESLSQGLQLRLLNLLFGKHPPELRPDHSLLAQNSTIRGDFLEKVRTGLVTVQRAGIESVGETSLRLTNGTELADLDAVICCTGYENLHLPYLPPDVLAEPAAPVTSTTTGATATPPKQIPGSPYLYHLFVPPAHQTLFLTGFLETQGPAAPPIEAQTRLATAFLTGAVAAPSPAAMHASIVSFRARQAERFVSSERHALQGGYVSYIDDVLAPLGARPDFWKVVRSGGGLGVAWDAWMAIASSAQWRLVGRGAKKNLAAETVVRTAKGKGELSEGERRELGLPLKTAAGVA